MPSDKKEMGDWATRAMGAIALIFGLLVIWQPQYIVWLLGGILIIMGVVILISMKTYILPIMMLIGGGAILLYPSFLNFAIIIIALVIGFILIAQEPRSKTKMAIGLGIILIAVLSWLLPYLLGTIVGIALIFVGILFLVGGNIEEIPIAGKEWKRVR